MAKGADPYTITLDDDPTAVLVATGRIGVASFFIHNNDAQTGYLLMFDADAITGLPDGDPLPDYVVGVAAAGVAQGQFCLPIMFTNGLVIAFSATSTGATPTTGSSAEVSLGLVRF